jgi:tripeptide aminopeptidase
MDNYNRTEISRDLLDRFLRYVVIDTTSDRHVEEIPSTPGQWDLLRLLQKELEELGIEDVNLNKNGYLIARIQGRRKAKGSSRGGDKPIGLMAHVDTSSDVSGKDVHPRVFENYQGGDIEIGEGFSLKVAENPKLAELKGDTIITSDGSTLLGADDKAGVAEIMTGVKWLIEHPEVEHGPFEVIFTPDEETGKGMNLFPLKELNSEVCYTFDGGGEGGIEGECFNAYTAKLVFKGRMAHLGDARGKLVNAVSMAAAFAGILPRSESPEATDGRFGYFAPFEIKGDPEQAELVVYLRDFEQEGMRRRVETLEAAAAAVEQSFHGGRVEIDVKKVYSNMRDFIMSKNGVMERLEAAIRKTGLEPVRKIIRGGTDGARLSEMGIPAPNVFSGGYNFHSRQEWASLRAMTEAAETVINLVTG